MAYQGYDIPPQIGFVGSSIPGLPTTLDEVNPAYYDQILKFVMDKGGRLASFSGVVLYDTLRIDAGGILFFSKIPLGPPRACLSRALNTANRTSISINGYRMVVNCRRATKLCYGKSASSSTLSAHSITQYRQPATPSISRSIPAR